MHLVFSGKSILIFNYEGDYSPELLSYVTNMIRSSGVEYEVMITPSILDRFNKQKSITGPIFVR